MQGHWRSRLQPTQEPRLGRCITTNEVDEIIADDQTSPLYEELGTIQRAIVDLRAHTLAGAVAKAHHVRWCRAGDLTTEMNGRGTDLELCMSIVRDLLAIRPNC